MDPNNILFSTPTISNDLGPLKPFSGKVGKTDLVFHEDEWRQVEFIPADRLAEIQRMMTAYKVFEVANKVQYGWRKVYVRNLPAKPVLPGGDALRKLEQELKVKGGPAPILEHGGGGASQVTEGFTIPVGINISLYGFRDGTGIPVLGVALHDADDQVLTGVFQKLNRKFGLLLVDWRMQMILVGTTNGQIDLWRP